MSSKQLKLLSQILALLGCLWLITWFVMIKIGLSRPKGPNWFEGQIMAYGWYVWIVLPVLALVVQWRSRVAKRKENGEANKILHGIVANAPNREN